MVRKTLPTHIAIIMDGNGRWAQQRNLHRTEGHRRGIKVVEEIVAASSRLGIRVLSLYAFSTENWARPKKEIAMLFSALKHFLSHKIAYLVKHNIQLRVMGDISVFPADLQAVLLRAQEKTKQGSGLVVNLALNYGARAEILKATQAIAENMSIGNLAVQDINEKTFSDFLYTKGLPDPDLLIRTSGEERLSNFMLWQLSYAELYFCKKFWPDFTEDDLNDAILVYQERQRRFGGVDV